MAPGSQRFVRLALAGAVVLVHVALIAWWWRALPSARRDAPQPASRMTIQLLPLPVADPAPLRPAPLPESLRRATAPRQVALPAPTLPMPATVLPTATDPLPSTATSRGPLPAEPASAPLDLALPKWHRPAPGGPSAVERALDDPRSNTARLTPEQRMNRRFDTAEHIDTLADGSVRTRRGDSCTISRPTRAMQLDPFDTVHNRAAGVEACP